ncbi:hypothetical protein JCM10212_001727 [Sporobolomyces blumeae]
MQHPVQALATTDALVITASNETLTAFDLATNAQVATSKPHKALVRSLATFTDPATSTSFLVSTGEDKLLVVSSLPSLETLSTRELPKRANAIDVTPQGEIVVGDKFGDVYIFPLHAPTSEAEAGSTTAKPKDKKQPEYLPILGHVSMLNALALIPTADGKMYIATGDREEHVRISRFPMGYVIEGYLWGSKSFVSSLLYLPPASPDAPSYLVSGGGDSTLQLFQLTLPSRSPAAPASSSTASPIGDLVSQFNVEDLLMPYVHVGPVMPDPTPVGTKKGKKLNKKGKGKQADGEPAEAANEAETEAAPAAGAEDVGAEAQVDADGQDDDKKELKKGLSIIKMIEVGTTREKGGIVVLAAGSTALLYIPFSALLPSSSASTEPKATPSLVAFAHPILDLVPLAIPSSAASACEFLVSFDSTRPVQASSSSSSEAPPDPLARVSLTESGQLVALPTLTTDSILLSSCTTESSTRPSVQSLYPTLMLLHHPGDESDLVEATEPSFVGDGKPKGGLNRGQKRTSSERTRDDGDEQGEGEKRGKRAIGRQETLRRWEEAKKKLEQGTKRDELNQDEQDAVTEIEMEVKEGQVATEEGSVVA